MSTENTTAELPDEQGIDDVATVAAVNPITGEVLDHGAGLDRLADELEEIARIAGELNVFRQAVIDEVANRADKLNKRKVDVGDGRFLETNAPTESSYRLDVLKAELEALVASDVLAPEVLRTVIVRPPPSIPMPRVDKREVNKLKANDDRRVQAAIAKARVITNTRRTVKLAGERREG